MGYILRLLKARLNAPRPSSKSFQRSNQDTSHASGARLRHRISRVPGLGAGLSSFHERVDQVRTSIAGRLHSALHGGFDLLAADRKSTRLNSSHLVISYAVFCLKKKKTYLHATQLINPYSALFTKAKERHRTSGQIIDIRCCSFGSIHLAHDTAG